MEAVASEERLDEWPSTIEDALALAARDGRDSSGRFLLGAGMVEHPAAGLSRAGSHSVAEHCRAGGLDDLAAGGRPLYSEDSLSVVRQRSVLVLGLLACWL